MASKGAMAETGFTAPFAVPMATLYVGLLFALPARALPPVAYAALLIGLSAAYFLLFFREIFERWCVAQYIGFASLVILYVALSEFGWLRDPDRLFASARVLPQAAGIVIMLITAPVFFHAARTLFLPRVRLVPVGMIVAAVTYSVLVWQDGEQMLQDNGLYGVQSAGMMLQFAYFVCVLRVPSRAARFVLIALPVPLLLAASNVAIQLALALCILLPDPRQFVRWLPHFVAVLLVAIAFPSGPVATVVAADDNTMVRSRLWSQALDQIPQNPLGVGFGQSSVTVQGLKDPWVRHVFSRQISRSLEVSNHSSVIDIALRLGWVGLALFFLLIRRLWRDSSGAGMDLQAAGALAFMLISCAFNPVLESVRSTLFFAFALGYLAAIRPRPPAGAERAVQETLNDLRQMPSPARRRRELATGGSQGA